MNQDAQRRCLNCNKTLHGRIDKKFCDDYCRNSYNNRQLANDGEQVKAINAILKKNRKILQDFLGESNEMLQVARQKLADAGFNFTYYTHHYTTKKGGVYTFIYEYGYLLLESERILIVKRENEPSIKKVMP